MRKAVVVIEEECKAMGLDEDLLVEPSKVSDNLRCPICLQVLENPVFARSGDCQCTFCNGCIQEAFRRCEKKCPVCRLELDRGKLVSHRVLKSLVGELHVRCGLCRAWTGPHDALPGHLEKCPSQLERLLSERDAKIKELERRLAKLDEVERRNVTLERLLVRKDAELREAKSRFHEWLAQGKSIFSQDHNDLDVAISGGDHEDYNSVDGEPEEEDVFEVAQEEPDPVSDNGQEADSVFHESESGVAPDTGRHGGIPPISRSTSGFVSEAGSSSVAGLALEAHMQLSEPTVAVVAAVAAAAAATNGASASASAAAAAAPPARRPRLPRRRGGSDVMDAAEAEEDWAGEVPVLVRGGDEDDTHQAGELDVQL